MWTHFWDMHSGGEQKERFAHCFIEAPEDEAKIIFYNRFGHNPDRVTCTCCGNDYSITECDTLAEATAYQRNCEYDQILQKYVEFARKSEYVNYDHIPLEKYIQQDDVMVIFKEEILDSERYGDLPQQGYIWMD